MKNIVLTGFMGTGKTVAAKRLARELGIEYVSIDDLIELKEKKKIKDIFSGHGEEYFRKLETEVITRISEKENQVIDTGGGVVLNSDNIDILSKSGIVICLWADPEVVYERTVKHGHRPLLNVDDPMAKIRELLDYRRPYYEKAEKHIDTSYLGIDEVLEQIKRIVYGTE